MAYKLIKDKINKIKFEIPKKPKIELKENSFYIYPNLYGVGLSDGYSQIIYFGKHEIKNGLARNDKETAEEALKAIKRFSKLLALRDQECEDSRGYEYKIGDNNYYILKEYRQNEKPKWIYGLSNDTFEPDKVYFKTEEDAQKICDILNSDKFDLEGE